MGAFHSLCTCPWGAFATDFSLFWNPSLFWFLLNTKHNGYQVLFLKLSYFLIGGDIALQYWWLLPYISMNQLGILCPLLLDLPPASQPIPPSRLSQSSGPELPASYSEFPLAVYFTHGGVYVSVLLSQFIPPLSFPASVSNSSPPCLRLTAALQIGSSVPAF